MVQKKKNHILYYFYLKLYQILKNQIILINVKKRHKQGVLNDIYLFYNDSS